MTKGAEGAGEAGDGAFALEVAEERQRSLTWSIRARPRPLRGLKKPVGDHQDNADAEENQAMMP